MRNKSHEGNTSMIHLAYFLKFFFGIKCILKICVGKLTFVVMPNITGKGLSIIFIRFKMFRTGEMVLNGICPKVFKPVPM